MLNWQKFGSGFNSNQGSPVPDTTSVFSLFFIQLLSNLSFPEPGLKAKGPSEAQVRQAFSSREIEVTTSQYLASLPKEASGRDETKGPRNPKTSLTVLQ